ncbi:histidine phosphatase superfamily [Lipomyces arxii]|uniref:histidine phosphatase superfamily n=1 Tax=Lipomyces arxii TaxID=56418 RepID=UPI0034CD096A
MGSPSSSSTTRRRKEIKEFVDEIENDDRILQIFIIRHGQTNENVRRIIQGHQNTNLNDLGISQAKTCGSLLQYVHFDAIWSSDLNRCIQTRDQALATQIGVLPKNRIHTTTAFRERSFGDLEGCEASVATKILQRRGQNWMTAGEDVLQFQNKVLTGFDTAVADSQEHRFKRIAIVSHGGTIASLINGLLKRRGFRLSDHIPNSSLGNLGNTSITIVNVGGDDIGEVVEYNNGDHLTQGTDDDITQLMKAEVVDNF